MSISGAIGPRLRPPEPNHQSLDRMGERIHCRRRLIAAMGHAVGAFLIAAGAVAVPVGALHELLEGLGVAFAEQVARPLPAEHVAGRIAPRRALILLIAGEEIEEQGRLVELPVACASAAPEDLAEQLLGVAAVEKMLLVGRPLIGIARARSMMPSTPSSVGEVEEGGDVLGRIAVEQRGVDIDPEPARPCAAWIAATARSNTPCWQTDAVVLLAQPVQMDREGEIRRSARTDRSSSRAAARWCRGRRTSLGARCRPDDLRRFPCGSTARRRGSTRSAHRTRRPRRGSPRRSVACPGSVVGIVDLAAAGAGEVAAEQRLEHQHQGIAPAAHQPLFDDIGPHGDLLFQRYGHYAFLVWVVGKLAPTGLPLGGCSKEVKRPSRSAHGRKRPNAVHK